MSLNVNIIGFIFSKLSRASIFILSILLNFILTKINPCLKSLYLHFRKKNNLKKECFWLSQNLFCSLTVFITNRKNKYTQKH